MMKKAFTMLELVMVIVVMGIVASIGADIIANLYENYIKTRAINRLQSQTELALDQIAKRLQFRIKDSVIARNQVTFADYKTLPDANSSYNIIEWIGKSNESFLGENGLPGWSGFINMDSNETNSTLGANGRLKTSGSRLDYANNIISALSYGQVDLNGTTTQRPAIVFKGKDSFDINEYGWDSNDGNYTYRVSLNSNDTLDFAEAAPNEIFEQYNLVWSAYAIVPQGTANDFNLTLHHNYQPWHNEDYRDVNGTVIVEHASTFRFTQIGETIRVKLCIHDNNQSGDYDFSFCKERVIY